MTNTDDSDTDICEESIRRQTIRKFHDHGSGRGTTLENMEVGRLDLHKAYGPDTTSPFVLMECADPRQTTGDV